ncbi:MAG: family 10 glycosylhydrolase [Bacteroidota bacterium]
MKKFATAVLITLLAVIFLLPSMSSAQKREIRGAWIATVANIDWPSGTNVESQKSQLRTILDKLSAAGINVAIFQIRPECDALYNSPYEPWSKWLTGAQGIAPNPMWDPLEFAVQEAHMRGMELHAWFNPYRAERAAGDYTTSGSHVTKAHPEWVLQQGSVRFLDPGLQDVRNHVAKVISDVVRRYDIDAAHMDDYFYPDGVTTQDAATFANYPRGFSVLGDWRRDNVNLLIKQVYDSIQVIKPWVKWGISPRGIWRNNVPSGIVGNDNYNSIYCDATAWMNGKYIDYLAPQLYWKITGNQDYSKLLPWWYSVANGRQIIPGLALYRIGEATFGNANEIGNQIRIHRANPNGVGNFAYTTNSITDNRGGISDSLTNFLYKYKALVVGIKGKDSLPPNPPANIRFSRIPGGSIAAVVWDVPAKAADNDSGSMYVIYKSTSGSITQNEVNDPKNIQTITSNKYLNPYGINGTVNFAVTALDRNHNESTVSSVVSIVSPPKQVTSVLPPDLASGQSSGVKLVWNYADSSSIYNVLVSADSTFTASSLNTNVFDTSLTASGLKGEQRYFWKVRGMNIVGNGNYSIARSFMTGHPADPPLIQPADLQINTPLTMTFSWVKTPVTQSFAFQLSRSSDFTLNNAKDTSGFGDTSITVAGLLPNTIYFWRVKGTNGLGTSDWASRKFKTQTSAFAAMNDVIPTEYQLSQNFPNPFNPSTNLIVSVKNYGMTSVKVYDILGREVAVLIDEDLSPGQYSLQFNASGLSSGFYVAVMRSGDFVSVKKMLFQK